MAYNLVRTARAGKRRRRRGRWSSSPPKTRRGRRGRDDRLRRSRSSSRSSCSALGGRRPGRRTRSRARSSSSSALAVGGRRRRRAAARRRRRRARVAPHRSRGARSSSPCSRSSPCSSAASPSSSRRSSSSPPRRRRRPTCGRIAPLELEGRDVYIREGCYNCHSQMIRPMRFETLRYGEASTLARLAFDHPFQWGSKRTGPDLAREGGKYPNLWHYRHMIDPRAIIAGLEHAAVRVPRERARSTSRARPTSCSAMQIDRRAVHAIRTSTRAADRRARARRRHREGPRKGEGVDVDAATREIVALIAYLQRLGKQPEPRRARPSTSSQLPMNGGAQCTTELLAQSPLLALPLVALFLFIAVFVGVCVVTLTKRAPRLRPRRRMPLDDDEDDEERHERRDRDEENRGPSTTTTASRSTTTSCRSGGSTRSTARSSSRVVYWFGDHQIGASDVAARRLRRRRWIAARREAAKQGARGRVTPEALATLAQGPATVARGQGRSSRRRARRATAPTAAATSARTSPTSSGSTAASPRRSTRRVHDGVPDKGMPAWGPQLGDETRRRRRRLRPHDSRHERRRGQSAARRREIAKRGRERRRILPVVQNDDERPRRSILAGRASRQQIVPGRREGSLRAARGASSSALLIALWAALPWIHDRRPPAVFLDIEHAQVLPLRRDVQRAGRLAPLLRAHAASGFGLVYATALLGRVWCGWACPQTVLPRRRLSAASSGSSKGRARSA